MAFTKKINKKIKKLPKEEIDKKEVSEIVVTK